MIKKIDTGKMIRFECKNKVELLAFVCQFTLKENIFIDSLYLIKEHKDTKNYYSDYYGENYEKAKKEVIPCVHEEIRNNEENWCKLINDVCDKNECEVE
jgi:hypothetical protein